MHKKAAPMQATGYLSENKYRNKDLEIQIPSAAGGFKLFPPLPKIGLQYM